MKILKKLKDNSGSSLIELVLGVTIFTIVAVGITNMLASANRQTMENKGMRVGNESIVGAMDSMIDPSITLTEIDNKVTAGELYKQDVNVSVTFPGESSSETVTAIKVWGKALRNGEEKIMSGISIVRYKN